MVKIEEVEFEKIYKLEIIIVFINCVWVCQDWVDQVYKIEVVKWWVVVNEIVEIYNCGWLVLVGIILVEKSELLSFLLVEQEIFYNLFNVKFENVECELEIVVQVGCVGVVIIVINMVGCGIDIIFGGNSDYMVCLKLWEVLLGCLVKLEEDYKLLVFLQCSIFVGFIDVLVFVLIVSCDSFYFCVFIDDID